MRSLRTAAFAFAATALSCKGPPAAPPVASAVSLKGRPFDARILSTEKERRHALDGLGPVAEGSAVLLAWPRERYLKLEGEDAQASFDAVFLDASGKVVDVQPLKQGEPEGIMSRVEAGSALLLAPGRAAALGVRAGDAAGLPALRPEELPVVRIGGVTATVELALTAAECQHGLMFRPRLSDDDGMLFAYDHEGPRRFWMGYTLIPLDIAFFKEDGTLLNVNETPPYADPRHPPSNYATSDSDGPARYVLEMNRGWFKKKGLVDASGKVKPGLKAVLPPEASKGSFD